MQDFGGRGVGEVAGLLNPAAAKDGPRRSADVISGGGGGREALITEITYRWLWSTV